MWMKVSLLAAVFFLLSLNAAAASPPGVSADGSLVLDTKESAVTLNSGDTLHDIQALEGQVQAYIFHNRTRIWTPNYVIRGRQASWQPLPHPQLESLIAKYSRYYGVDPSLIRAVMRHESGYNAQALSPKGAQGLMQLMPGTARLMGVRDPFDPEQNIAGGVGYLRHCLERFQHNVPLAVAAYNAGPEAVARYCSIPPYAETQNFVRNVLGTYGAPVVAPVKKGAPPSLAGGKKTRGQSQVAKAPSRPRGPKIIEVKPRKKSKTLAARTSQD